MKVLIVYDSAYGNTKRIAETIAGSFGRADVVNMILAAKATVNDLSAQDLVVVGSPTQGGRPTKPIQEFLDDIPPKSLNKTSVAAFDTRFAINEQSFGLKLLMKTIGYAAPRISTKLISKGGKLIARPEGFIVEDKKGPLKAGELERSAEWMKLHISGAMRK